MDNHTENKKKEDLIANLRANLAIYMEKVSWLHEERMRLEKKIETLELQVNELHAEYKSTL